MLLLNKLQDKSSDISLKGKDNLLWLTTVVEARRGCHPKEGSIRSATRGASAALSYR